MAKLDVSTIEGFDGMTAEQKVAALLGLEVPEKVDMSAYVPKATADKYASEAAELKKQLRATQTDEEAAKAEAEAKRIETEQKYNELLRKATVSEHTAKYLALGYEEKLARETAEALFDGDMEKVFANQQKANEAYKKRIEADAMRNMTPPAGGGSAEQGDSEYIRLAKTLGSRKAQAEKDSNDILKRFMKGET